MKVVNYMNKNVIIFIIIVYDGYINHIKLLKINNIYQSFYLNNGSQTKGVSSFKYPNINILALAQPECKFKGLKRKHFLLCLKFF